MYKEAIKSNFRFATTRGELTTEQLWGLSMSQLDELVVSLSEELEKTGKKSYLNSETPKNILIKKKFDIALDILQTKIDEDNQRSEALERKKFNEKIDELILKKQETELENLPLEELLKLKK
jgi:hypothetical protein